MKVYLETKVKLHYPTKQGNFYSEDIQKMRYSWNVVSKTMRLSPPTIGAFRDALLYWKALLTNTFSSLFQENIKFDPSSYERAGPTPFSYVPFGGGPRMCLGKEFTRLYILTFLHNIVKRFRWDSLIPDEKVEYIICPPQSKDFQFIFILISPRCYGFLC
ncbi:unnamed protein product [Fraxinus pennsylvanica]|uniref:Cytochrome P450 n=1 Tax=Fraxinus pennsylvanica TaxID=56036 RepID=A0AAD1ZGP1_9LAMI|nr:unnamed protein product [Fraxinus pennsylvanica]